MGAVAGERQERGGGGRRSGRWGDGVTWCGALRMPHECVLMISSRAWWWCGGAGRAGGLSFSETGGGRSGVSPGSGALRNFCRLGLRRKAHPEVVRWLGSRRRPPSGRSAVSVAAAAGAGSLWRRASTSKSIVRSLLLPASCLLLPRRRGWLAVSVETRKHQSLSLFDLPSPARLACWRAVTRKCARRSEMKGGSVDRCIEASQ